MSKPIVIAIDGPAGAGKSTVSKLLAAQLGLQYLDTGAMYRALAYKAHSSSLDLSDGEGLALMMASTVIAFGQGDPQPVFLDSVEVTAEIRTPAVGEMASKISAFSAVRRALVARQQEMVAVGGFILEGRDTTTVVAPNADVKVYLTASLEERAKRRTVEFVAKGLDEGFEDVRSQIEQRDHRDITRDDSPLKVGDGSVVIETAGLSPAEVVARIAALV